MKIVQILYSGLGGHGSVAFTLQQAAEQSKPDIVFSYVFYGVEAMTEGYKEKCSRGNNAFIYIAKKWKIDFSGSFKIYRFVNKVRPDAVICHNIVLLPILVLHRFFTRSTYTIIGVEHQPNNFKTFKEKFYTYLSFLLTDKLVYLTQLYIEEVKKYTWPFFSKRKIKVIPNALPDQFFEARTYEAGPPVLVISMQSRFTIYRDHETLIRAFKNIAEKYPAHKFKLVLAGDGDTKTSVQATANNIFPGGNIVLPGYLNEPGVIALLRETHIYVHSSLMETMSTAVMQTMGMSLPIVGTNISGVNNMIFNARTGLLFEPGDVQALTTTLEQLVENEKLRMQLGRNAHEYAVQHFKAEKNLADYLSLAAPANEDISSSDKDGDAGNNKEITSKEQTHIVQILFSGLGGPGAVAFTLSEAAVNRNDLSFSYIFYGIEPMTETYREKCKKGNNRYLEVLKKWKVDIAGSFKIYGFLNKAHANAVITHNVVLLPTIWLHRFLTRSKYTIICVEHQPYSYKSLKEKIATRISFLITDKLVYLTTAFVEEVQKHTSYFFKREKISVIPNALPEIFYDASERAAEPPVMTISMQSRFTMYRDHETLIRAFKIIIDKYPERKFRLVMAGDGDTKTKMEGIANMVCPEGDIVCPGNLGESQIVALLKQTDIYVHSSLLEAMSTALMQTMGMSLPIIATDIDGISHMIEDGKTGILVEPKNVQALAMALEQLIENDTFRKQLAYNAHQYALQHFNAHKNLSAYLKLITPQTTKK